MPRKALLFASPEFPIGGTGRDGWHFFMLIDSERSRAFVWVKNRF